MFHNLTKINKTILLFMLSFVCLGLALLYDAAGGNMDPWAKSQLIRFAIGLGIMACIIISPIKFWIKFSYSFYFIVLGLLALVLIMGHTGMGAQRWLKLGPLQIQPSEMMRVSLILALACYYHRRTHEEIQKISALFVPMLMILIPTALVAKQPDLGTAIMIFLSGIMVLFIAGVPKRVFIISGIGLISLIPIAWTFLHTYQKKRVLTFLNPERDPFGAGYHIMQSKIALGSGGLFGKGFMAGTQSHLNFLPEKQTDFIFTLFAEEFGFFGSILLLIGYFITIVTGIYLGYRCHSIFCRLVAIGLSCTIFLYVAINIAMVIGLVPVVGVPLPFVSYGGTAMWTLLITVGFILNADRYHDQRLERYY